VSVILFVSLISLPVVSGNKGAETLVVQREERIVAWCRLCFLMTFEEVKGTTAAAVTSLSSKELAIESLKGYQTMSICKMFRLNTTAQSSDYTRKIFHCNFHFSFPA
jgi:hypothetical protein